MESLTHPTFRTHIDFAAYLLAKMEEKGFPVSVINKFGAVLWPGAVCLDKRKMDLIPDMLGLDLADRIEFRWHYLGGD